MAQQVQGGPPEGAPLAGGDGGVGGNHRSGAKASLTLRLDAPRAGRGKEGGRTMRGRGGEGTWAFDSPSEQVLGNLNHQ